MSKTHPRQCIDGENPCKREHTYECSVCGQEFVCDESTQYYDLHTGVTLPIAYWPAHSFLCHSILFPGSSDPELPPIILDDEV